MTGRRTHQHYVPIRATAALRPHVGEARVARLAASIGRLRDRLGGRRLVHVTGDDRRKGGVYEILRSTLPYLRGQGVDVAWIDLPTRAEARPALD